MTTLMMPGMFILMIMALLIDKVVTTSKTNKAHDKMTVRVVLNVKTEMDYVAFMHISLK